MSKNIFRSRLSTVAIVFVLGIASLAMVGCGFLNKKEVAPNGMELDIGNDYIIVESYSYEDNLNRVVEYQLDDNGWQDDNKFEQLTAGTEYTVSIRTKSSGKPSDPYSQTVTLPKYDQELDEQQVSLNYTDNTVFVTTQEQNLELSYDQGRTWTDNLQYTYDSIGLKTILARLKETATSNVSQEIELQIDISGFYTGTGVQSDPYVIQTQAQFLMIGTKGSAWYKLDNDISLDGIIIDQAIKTKNYNGGGSTLISGGFDGNNKTISNVTVQAVNYGNVALFDFFGTVKNLTVKDLKVSADFDTTSISPPIIYNNFFVGGIVGFANIVSNCSVSGQIDVNVSINLSTAQREIKIGGVVGAMSYSDLNSCQSFVDINYNKGKSPMSAIISIGGLVGWYDYTNTAIVQSMYDGTIDASGYGVDIGGIVGTSDFDVENCYSLGQIVANGGSRQVGGIVGAYTAGKQIKVSNSYSSMDISIQSDTVTDNPYIGGILGYTNATSGLEQVNCLFGGTFSVDNLSNSIVVYVGVVVAPIGGGVDNAVLSNSDGIDNCHYTPSANGTFVGDVGFVSRVENSCELVDSGDELKADWQRDILGFDSNIWDMQDGRLPTLKN